MNESQFQTFKLSDVINNLVDDKGKLIKVPGIPIKGFKEPQDGTQRKMLIPSLIPNYVFRGSELGLIARFFLKKSRYGLWVSGPTGSGKSSVIEQFCARLNWPVVSCTGSGRFEFSQLVGSNRLTAGKNGEAPTMKFELGPLAQAMLNGYVFIFNEADLADPSELTALNEVLEGKDLYIPENGGMIIKPHPMFRLVCTGNSAGSGDDTGAYAGISQQNMALMDRFYFLEVGYMSEETEEQAFALAFPTIPKEWREKMVRFAVQIRSSFERGDLNSLSIPMSTRTLYKWADNYLWLLHSTGTPEEKLYVSFQQALGARYNSTDRQVVCQLARAIFGEAWPAIEH